MNQTEEISYTPESKTLLDILHLYENGHLNLNPGFQRKSVWVNKDRSLLIDSIVRNYPLPAIFLYKRKDSSGNLIYDVIDGKQRIESILMFIGKLRGKFESKVILPNETEERSIDWAYLKKKNLQYLVLDRHISTIIVVGTTGSIIELFVRINSTGKSLTKAEKQNAKYSNSAFLKAGIQIAAKNKEYFIKSGILSDNQTTRMKHIELVCEIMFSIHKDDVINKKAALDSIMAKDDLTIKQINSAKERTTKAINRVNTMFPLLKQTRFKQVSDYYILVLLIARYETDGLILIDKKRNKLAWDLLKEFSTGTDNVRTKQKEFKAINESEQMYRDYLLTVLQGSDDKTNRASRMRIIDGLLRSLFEQKDSQRSFSPEQRRIIWHSSSEKKCVYPGCRKILTWEDFTIDHIDSHSTGGKSKIKNAALMCKPHNSKKGNKSLSL